jgi:hypothetical protein
MSHVVDAPASRLAWCARRRQGTFGFGQNPNVNLINEVRRAHPVPHRIRDVPDGGSRGRQIRP